MNDLKTKGFFKLSQESINNIKKDFCAEKINDEETLAIIKKFYIESKFILDPHTATAFGAVKKISNLSETIILGTAHPYKFLETVKKATDIELEMPSQLSNVMDKEERFDIIENIIPKIKNYILEKTI
jgi:threonine synthase